MKKWLKALIATFALVAMLSENMYSVYAAVGGNRPVRVATAEETASEMIEVGTEEVPAESAETAAETVVDETVTTPEETAEVENNEEENTDQEIGVVSASEEEEEEPRAEVAVSLEEKDGKLIGEGYNSLFLSMEASSLPDDTYYVLHIDTDALVEYDGSGLRDNQLPAISNKVSDIYLSNLNNLPFALYVRGENSDEVGADYYIESATNGAVRVSLNMDGSNIEETEEEEPEENHFVTVRATIVDEFGDEIGETYSDLELPIDDNGLLTLDDIDQPPFENFEIDLGAGKLVKYTYEKAQIGNTVISALRCEEVPVEETEETGLVYEYKTTGSDWKRITEDTELKLVYSDGKKTIYNYEDDDILVTATLQHANAIPDDAEFIVTPITKGAKGYDYDTYMEALNENAEEILGEEGAIDETNTLLYDIGFFVTDEEGNRVEVQPQDGSVKISIRFKKAQLEEKTDAEAEVTLVHLPLTDEMKEKYATTEEATDLTTADVKVEILGETVTAETEKAEFTLQDFSPVALVGTGGKMSPGVTTTFQDALGAASAFGIVANTVHIAGHLESNLAVGSLSGGVNINTCKNDGNAAGVSYIASYQKGGDFFMDPNGNDSPAILYTTETAVANMHSSMAQGRNGIIVNTSKYTEQQIRTKVSDMVNAAKAKSTEIGNIASYQFYDVVTKNQWSPESHTLDLKSNGNGPGTYYIQFQPGEFQKFYEQGNKLKIVLGEGQNVVFNIPDQTVKFFQYEFEIGNLRGHTNGNSNEDPVCQSVIFNCPNATTTETVGPCAGTFLVPRSTFSNNAVSSGWVIADKIAKIGGQEWHCVYHDMPSNEPFEETITAEKTINGKTPGSMEKFWFDLQSYDWNTTEFTTIQSKQNNGGTITFDPISYSKEGTYSYRVMEREVADDGYVHEEERYLVHHKVRLNTTTRQYEIYEKNIYYRNGKDYAGNNYNVIKFDNKKELNYQFDIEKKFGTMEFGKPDTYVAGEWPDGVSFDFVLRPFNGGSTNTGITYPGPMPAGSMGEGANAYKTITLTKENRTGSFGTISVLPDTRTSDQPKNYRQKLRTTTYMYTIEEVVPTDKPVGVQYTADPIRYIKLFVNTYMETDGSYTVEIEDKESEVNNNGVPGRECIPHIPGPYVFVNDYQPASLTVKKVVNDQDGNAAATEDEFYVTVYRLDANQNRVYYDTNGKKYSAVHVETLQAQGSLTFQPLEVGVNYYVIETDANGNQLQSGRTFEYTVAYDGLSSSGSVTLTGNNNHKEVTITNTQLERGSVTLIKKGGSKNEPASGNTAPMNLAGVTFMLKEDDGTNGGEGTRVYATRQTDGVYTYAETGSTLQELVTDANGEITISNLPIGNYYLKETALPDAYADAFVMLSGRIKFTVDVNGTTLTNASSDVVQTAQDRFALTLTAYNHRVPVAIRVRKDIVNAEGESLGTTYSRQGFKFHLYDVTGGGRVDHGSATTNADGTAVFTGNLQLGRTYRLEEDESVANSLGFILKSVTPAEFTVDNTWYQNPEKITINGATYLVKDADVKNAPVTGKVRLLKQNGKGETITDGSAEFVLSTSANIANTSSFVRISGTRGTYSYDVNSSNTTLQTENGELTVDQLAPGTYYFIETKSPDANQYTFAADAAYAFTIQAENANESAVVELVSDEDAVKVANAEFIAGLSFRKVNGFDPEKGLNAPTEFTLYETNGLGGTSVGNFITRISPEGGEVKLTVAKAGTYVLEETATEAGYEPLYDSANLKIYFEVTAAQANEMNLTLQDVNAYTNQNGRVLTNLVDQKNNLVKNEPKRGQVTLHKRFLDKDGNEINENSDAYKAGYLGEAVFKLYTNSAEYKTLKNKSAYVIADETNYIEYTDGTGYHNGYTTQSRALTLTNLPWGSYYFQEIATVQEDHVNVYQFDQEAYYFLIGEKDGELVLNASSFMTEAGKTVSLIDNEIKTGAVKIIKKDQDTGKAIKDIRFDLVRVLGNTAVQVGSYTTDGNGAIAVSNLEFGTYYFIESADQTVAGYEFDTTTQYLFKITGEDNPVQTLTYTLNQNGQNQVQTIRDGVITNAPKKGKVSLDKYAIVNGNAEEPEYLGTLQGAEFELYTQEPSTPGQKILSWFSSDERFYVYKADGNGTYITDENGNITVTGLPWGNYYFLETKAPEGYQEIEQIPEESRKYGFIIDGDHLEVYIGRENNEEISGRIPVNERYQGAIQLTKKDAETGLPISGVAFRLLQNGADITGTLTLSNTPNLGTYLLDDASATLLLTDAEGKISVRELPWGTYVFEEAEVPVGYRADSANLKSEALVINASNVSAEATYVTAEMSNTPIKGKLSLRKVDEDANLLTGATFDLVRVLHQGATDAKRVKVNVSGSAGNYVYAGTEETEYLTAQTGIAAFFANIFNGGSQVGSLETTGGTLTVDALPFGDYEIYEVTAPDGYEPAGEGQSLVRAFTIDGENDADGNDAAVTFVNSKVFASVQFVKTVGNQTLKGARFQLQKFSDGDWADVAGAIATAGTASYYAAGDKNNEEIGTFDGVVTFENLPVGSYRFYEISASSRNGENAYPYLDHNGVLIWSTPEEGTTKFYSFEIEVADHGMRNVGLEDPDGSSFNGAPVQTVENQERPGRAKLIKTYGDEGLSGVKFALYRGEADKNGSAVLGTPSTGTQVGGELISDQDGVVRTSDLTWGHYYLVETQTQDASFFLETNIDDRMQYHFYIGPNADGTFTEEVTSFTAISKETPASVTSAAQNRKIYGQASFTKRDEYSMQPILSEDITFDLYYLTEANMPYTKLEAYSGDHALNAGNGTITTKQDLAVGKYYFIETSTAEGYKELPTIEERTKYHFEILQGDTPEGYTIQWMDSMPKTNDGAYYVTNAPEKGSVKLLKYYIDLDGDAQPLAGATFRITGKTVSGDTYSAEITSLANGEVVFAGLPWGTYSISEVAIPAGYQRPEGMELPKDIKISGTKLHYVYDSDDSLKIENERKRGELKLKKVENKSQSGLAGVAFELQRGTMSAEGNWIWTKVSNPDAEDGLYTTGEGGFLSFFDRSKRKGELVLKDLEWGQYRVIERKVPEGYLIDGNPIPNENGVSIGAENLSDPNLSEDADVLVYDLGDVENSNVHGNIALKKIDSDRNGLAGAEFKLYQAAGENHQARPVYVSKTTEGVYAYVSMDAAVAAENSESTLTLISPEGTDTVDAGKIKVTGLPCGTYYMQETKEPNPGKDTDGNTILYQMNQSEIGPFVVDHDQTADEDAQAKNYLNWENGSGQFGADLLFYKEDARENGLNGVVYRIASVASGATWTVTSASEGERNGVVRAHFTSIGSYQLKEESTPNDAYDVDPNVYTFEITEADNGGLIYLADRIGSLPAGSKLLASRNTFENDEAKGRVKLYKEKSESSGDAVNPIGGLNGVVFKLYKGEVQESNLIRNKQNNTDTFITASVGGEEGVITVDGLDWGDYIFVEESAPAGYSNLDENGHKRTYPFTIDADTFNGEQKIAIVRATNKREEGSLIVEKTFENPENNFDGENVKFTLTLIEGTSDIVTNAVYEAFTVKNAEDGKYYIEFNHLPWGIYTLKEEDTKDGYIQYEDTKTIKIGNAENSASGEYQIDAEGLHVELTGNRAIVNKKIKGSVKLHKLDADTNVSLANVAFKLYKGETPTELGMTTTALAPVVLEPITNSQGIFYTDENGYFEFPNESLEYGHYYLEEAVPQGYQGSRTTGNEGELSFTYQGVNFDILNKKPVELTRNSEKPIKNTPERGTVILTKKDNHGKPMKNVTFILYSHDAKGMTGTNLVASKLYQILQSIRQGFTATEEGEVYARKQTDENGVIEFKDLPWGTYHFVEEVPAGYSVTPEQQALIETPFTIDASSSSFSFKYEFEFTNDEVLGSVNLKKYGKDGNREDLLPGAEFALYRIKGEMDLAPGTPAGPNDEGDTPVRESIYTSDEAGESFGTITVSDLPWGQYYFYEVKAPFGYDKSTDKPEILTIGRTSTEAYTDVSNDPAPNFLSPSVRVVNNKGYGYVALYKEFDEIGMEGLNKALTWTDENGTTTYLTFEIYALDDSGKTTGTPITLTDNGNPTNEFRVDGETKMTGLLGPLPYGRYAFVEKEVPAGVDYEKSDVILPFTIDDSCTQAEVESEMAEVVNGGSGHTFVLVKKFVNTIFRGWCTIEKVDAVENKPVGDIDFIVYEATITGDQVALGSQVGNPIRTDDRTGQARIDGLPLGTYAFIEDQFSARSLGYVPSQNAFVFEITEDGVRENARPKVREAVYNNDGSSDVDGNYNADGTYTLGSEENIATVENGRQDGKIRLKKTDRNGNPLAGAYFALYKVNGVQDAVPGTANGTEDERDQMIGTPHQTNAAGELVVEGLKWGSYYFVETVPPQGYRLTDEIDPKIVVIDGTSVTGEVQVTAVDDTIKIDIKKTDITGTKELAGAELEIYLGEDKTSPLIHWISDGMSAMRIEIGEDFGGLEATLDPENPIVYRLHEKTAPTGYTVTADVYFSVDGTGKVTLYNRINNAYVPGEPTNITLTTTDHNGNALEVPLMELKDAVSTIRISKRELGTDRYLPGAKLRIYDEANYNKYLNNDPTAVWVFEKTTNDGDGGAFDVTGVLAVSPNTSNIKRYYLVEVEIPAGYYKANDVCFYISNENKISLHNTSGDEEQPKLSGDSHTLFMYDRPIYVLVNKRAPDGEENLAGAELNISNSPESTVRVNKTFETTQKPTLLVPVTETEAMMTEESKAKYDALAENYQIEWGVKFIASDDKNDPTGKYLYTLHESAAPVGYQLAGDQRFRINKESEDYKETLGIYEKTMLDAPIRLYVSKQDMVAAQELAGAKLAIYEKSVYDQTGVNATPVVSWISGTAPQLITVDADGKGALKRDTDYVLVETTAPLGYAYAAEIEFKVKADGKISTGDTVHVNGEEVPLLTMQDDPLALAILKTDTDGNSLRGAKLELRDHNTPNATVLATWESEVGKPAFISNKAEPPSAEYQKVTLKDGVNFEAGKTYYVVETEAPTGYEKLSAPVPVTAVKMSEITKSEPVVYSIKNARGGETHIGGSKTWKISDVLQRELAGKKVKINLYRYYEATPGQRMYVGLDGAPKSITADQDGKLDLSAVLLDTRELTADKTNDTYMFDHLDQYYYAYGGVAHEYTYFVEEDLSEINDLVVSVRKGNDFTNYQKYKEIEGDKKWILFKGQGGAPIDIADDADLRAAIGVDDKTVSAYADVDVILCRLENGTPVIIDEDGDGTPDYYVTIRHGALTEENTEEHESTTENQDAGQKHISIVWTQAGQVKFKFDRLPAYDTKSGDEIMYAFIERPVLESDKDKYTVVFDEEGNAYGTNGVTITNKPVHDPFTIRGQKTWKDPFDASVTQRPEVSIQLYRDGVSMGDAYKVTLKAENNYRFEFKDLWEYAIDGTTPETSDGHKFNYEIREVGATGNYDITIQMKDQKIVRLQGGEGRELQVPVTNRIKDQVISISGTKTFDYSEYTQSKKVPENPKVTFNLYATDSTRNHVKVKSTTIEYAKGHTYEFTNLPKFDTEGKIITYTVEEDLSNLGGYQVDPATGITVKPTADPTQITYKDNNFTNTPSILRIRKVDIANSANLAGATLQVVDKNGKEVDRWVTTTEDHYIEGLTFGETYTLNELRAPSRYSIAAPIRFTVDETMLSKAGTTPRLITMSDERITGRVTLTKRDAETRETLSGAVFELYESGGRAVHVTGSGGVYKYSSDASDATSMAVSTGGTLEVTELPFGTYYFRERTAPVGYTLSTRQESFTIAESGASREVTFLNERSTGSVTLRKIATGTSTTLAGARFELYSATPRSAGAAVASTVVSDAYYRYGSYTTGADGTIRVTGLPWDSYYFIEVEPPAGYRANYDVNGDPLVYTFTIDASSASASGAVSLGSITNDTSGGGGGGGGTGGTVDSGVAGVRRRGGVLSDVLGVRAAPTSGVLGVRSGPVTGDAANIALWLLLLLASISAIVVICIQSRRKKKTGR